MALAHRRLSGPLWALAGLPVASQKRCRLRMADRPSHGGTIRRTFERQTRPDSSSRSPAAPELEDPLRLLVLTAKVTNIRTARPRCLAYPSNGVGVVVYRGLCAHLKPGEPQAECAAASLSLAEASPCVLRPETLTAKTLGQWSLSVSTPLPETTTPATTLAAATTRSSTITVSAAWDRPI